MLHHHCFKCIQPCSCFSGQVGHVIDTPHMGKGCQVKLFVALLLQCSWFCQDLVGVADNRLADGHPFQIALLLEQKLFFGRNLFRNWASNGPLTLTRFLLCCRCCWRHSSRISCHSRSERPWT